MSTYTIIGGGRSTPSWTRWIQGEAVKDIAPALLPFISRTNGQNATVAVPGCVRSLEGSQYRPHKNTGGFGTGFRRCTSATVRCRSRHLEMIATWDIHLQIGVPFAAHGFAPDPGMQTSEDFPHTGSSPDSGQKAAARS